MLLDVVPRIYRIDSFMPNQDYYKMKTGHGDVDVARAATISSFLAAAWSSLYHAVKRVLCLIGKVRVVIREVLGVPAVASTLMALQAEPKLLPLVLSESIVTVLPLMDTCTRDHRWIEFWQSCTSSISTTCFFAPHSGKAPHCAHCTAKAHRLRIPTSSPADSPASLSQRPETEFSAPFRPLK